jgi:hypothetical protein
MKRLTLQFFRRQLKKKKRREAHWRMYIFVYLFSTCGDSFVCLIVVVNVSNVILTKTMEGNNYILYAYFRSSFIVVVVVVVVVVVHPEVHLDHGRECEWNLMHKTDNENDGTDTSLGSIIIYCIINVEMFLLSILSCIRFNLMRVNRLYETSRGSTVVISQLTYDIVLTW